LFNIRVRKYRLPEQAVIDNVRAPSPGRVMRGTSVSFPDYTFYSTGQLLTAYVEGPQRMRRAIEGLSEEELRARARGPDRWSIHEIILHSADSEVQGTLRIRKVWSEPSPLLPYTDQDAFSRELGYAREGREARERALSLLALLRQHTVHLFERATAHDWAKVGTHPEYGEVTLRNLLELYADHTERHVEQILEGRRLLGRTLAMQSLLPRRLY
jgi:hypothetical protein